MSTYMSIAVYCPRFRILFVKSGGSRLGNGSFLSEIVVVVKRIMVETYLTTTLYLDVTIGAAKFPETTEMSVPVPYSQQSCRGGH